MSKGYPMKNKTIKIHWHNAHFEGLKLELHEYEKHLTFVYEHHLSKEALQDGYTDN